MRCGPFGDEAGVEPLAMKLFAGIVLLVIGLSIAYAIYTWAGKTSQGMLSFSVSLSPNSITVQIPDSGTATRNISVTVSRIGTYEGTVTLSATGQPGGVSVSFSPESGVPTFGSTMTITVDSGASAGTTTLTVRATGADGTQQTATLQLTLE